MSYKLDRKNVRQHAFKTNFIQIHTIIQLQVIKVLYVTIEFEDPVLYNSKTAGKHHENKCNNFEHDFRR